MSSVPGARVLQLLPPMVGFVARDALRPRRAYIVGTLLGVGLLEVLFVLRGGANGGGAGAFVVIGVLVVSAPLCRSWLDEDVRLGYGALWLQKPVGPVEFYLSRLVAATALALALGLGLVLATLPALMLESSSPTRLAEILFVAVPTPPLLVVLSFLGSGLGARNGGLFAYVLLFLGFWLPSLLANMEAGADRLGRIELILPPMRRLLEAGGVFSDSGLAASLTSLSPVGAYLVAAACLGLALALRVPKRLGRAV